MDDEEMLELTARVAVHEFLLEAIWANGLAASSAADAAEEISVMREKWRASRAAMTEAGARRVTSAGLCVIDEFSTKVATTANERRADRS